MSIKHRWAEITAGGVRGEVSADSPKKDGIRITPTMRQSLYIAKEQGAVLAPPHVLDARWEQADLKNRIHTQDLEHGQDDAVLQSQRIDQDVADFIAEHGYEPRIVGNACKSWTRKRESDGICELYGLFVPPERVIYRGGRHWGDGLPVYESESDETDAYIVQRSRDSSHKEHHDYLTGLILWRPLNAPESPPDTDRSPATSWHEGVDLKALSLGNRCLMWLGYQLGLKPREIPGPEHEPIILSYSKNCRRGGRFVGVREDGAPIWEGGTPLSLPTDDSDSPWCAALASATLEHALLPGEVPPHGLRVSVRELVEDARAAGTLRLQDWTPTPGSLAILARSGHDPLKGGPGHVRCVVGVDAGRYLGLGGNEGDTITCAHHSLTAPELRAWVRR
jgi:hypothetical protein